MEFLRENKRLAQGHSPVRPAANRPDASYFLFVDWRLRCSHGAVISRCQWKVRHRKLAVRHRDRMGRSTIEEETAECRTSALAAGTREEREKEE